MLIFLYFIYFFLDSLYTFYICYKGDVMDKKIKYNDKEYDVANMTIEERNKIKEEIKKNRKKLQEELKSLLKIGD